MKSACILLCASILTQVLYVSELKHMLSGLHHFIDILADGYLRLGQPIQEAGELDLDQS